MSPLLFGSWPRTSFIACKKSFADLQPIFINGCYIKCDSFSVLAFGFNSFSLSIRFTFLMHPCLSLVFILLCSSGPFFYRPLVKHVFHSHQNPSSTSPCLFKSEFIFLGHYRTAFGFCSWCLIITLWSTFTVMYFPPSVVSNTWCPTLWQGCLVIPESKGVRDMSCGPDLIWPKMLFVSLGLKLHTTCCVFWNSLCAMHSVQIQSRAYTAVDWPHTLACSTGLWTGPMPLIYLVALWFWYHCLSEKPSTLYYWIYSYSERQGFLRVVTFIGPTV